MKFTFAIALLLASTEAIKIRSGLKIKSHIAHKVALKTRQPANMPRNAREWMDALDTSGDGQISLEEALAAGKKYGAPKEMVLEAFNAANTDGDKFVSMKELKAAVGENLAQVKTKQPQGMPQSAQGWMELLDTNFSGTIELGEVLTFAEKMGAPPEMEQIITDQFNMADTDDSGSVNMKELDAAMKSHNLAQIKTKQPEGPPPQGMPQSAQEWMDVLDTNLSGTIELGELLSFAEKMGAPPEAEEFLTEQFNKADGNNDGAVNITELEAAINADRDDYDSGSDSE